MIRYKEKSEIKKSVPFGHAEFQVSQDAPSRNELDMTECLSLSLSRCTKQKRSITSQVLGSLNLCREYWPRIKVWELPA